MTTYSWKTAADADWATAGAWTPSGPPNATTADAVIGIAGTYGVTVQNGTTFSVNSLKLASAGASLTVGGTLKFAGAKTLTISAGTMNVGSGGTVQGAVISNTGGTINYSYGTLDAVTVRGTLDLSAAGQVYVTNGIALTGASGTGPGAVTIGGYYGNLYVVGTTTLDNATISISDYAGGGYGLQLLDQTATGATLTLGSKLVVQNVADSNGYAGGYLGGSNYATDGIVNKGTILAGAAAGNFNIGGNSFINQGSIGVSNGNYFSIQSTTLTNSGSITVDASTLILSAGWSNTGKVTVTNAGTLQLGTDTTTAWGSVGTISATASTVNLYGQFTTAKLKTLVLSGGTVNFYGNLVNTGTTLTVGVGSTYGLQSGTITGGVIAPGANPFAFSGGTLDGVTYRGTLDMSAVFSALTVAHGITLTGTSGVGAGAVALGSFGQLTVVGTTTLDNATITMSEYDGYNYGLTGYDPDASGQVLTLGSKLVVQVTADANGYAGGHLASGGQATDSLVNKGTILAAATNGYFQVAGNSFINQGTIGVSNGDGFYIQATTFSNSGTITVSAAMLILSSGWSNTGKITVTNGGTLQLGSDSTTAWGSIGSITATASTVNLYGQFTTAKLKTLALSSDTIHIAGNLVNTGTTLVVGAGTTLGTVGLQGTVTGGVIADAGSGFSFLSGTLDGVTYRGTLDVSTSSSSVTIADGIVLTGTSGTGTGVLTIGAFSNVFVVGTTTLDNATITISNSGNYYNGLQGYDADGSGQILTLGTKLVVQDSNFSGYAGAFIAVGYQTTDSLVNKGTILAGTAGGYFRIGGNNFVNQATIATSNGDVLTVTSTTFSNTGTITGAAASVVLYAGWSNTGKIAVTGGGTLQLGSDSTTAWGTIGSISATASTVNLYGRFTTAQAKTLVLSGSTLNVGGDLVNTGTTLVVGANTSLGTVGLLSAGTITGGVITGSASGNAFTGGTLDGVTYRGILDLSATYSFVYISDGIVLTGTSGTGAGAVMLGAFAQLEVAGTTTLDNATITMSSQGNYGYGVIGYDPGGVGETLTLGSKLVVQDSNVSGYAGGYLASGGQTTDSLVNKGTILAGTSAGWFTIGGQSFSNQGTIAVSNGDSLSIYAVTFTNLATTTLSGGTYSVTGASTLDVGTDRTVSTLSANLTLSGAGSLVRSYKSSTGTYTSLESTLSSVGTSGALRILGSRGYTTTKTITDNGILQLSGGTFASAGTLTVSATGTILGAGVIKPPVASAGLLYAQGGTLTFAGAVTGAGALRADAGAVLRLNQAAPTTIAGKVTLNGVGSVIQFGTATYTALESTLTSVAAAGTLAVLGGRGFTSTNTIADSGLFNIAGGTFSIAALSVGSGGRILGSGAIANAVANSGTIESNAGLLKLSAGASGAGRLVVDAASTLELGAAATAGTILDSGVLQLDGFSVTGAASVLAGGKILGRGTVANAAANAGTIESNGGLLKLSAGASGVGALVVDAGSTLELAAATTAGTILDSGVLKLDGLSVTGAASVVSGGRVLGFGTLASAVVNAGTIESNGGLLKLAAGATGAGALLVDAGSTLELAATTTAGTITGNGVLKLDGQTYTATATTIGTTGLVQGFGTLVGAVLDNGTIDAKGGVLKISNSVSGSGALRIENASTLQLAGATSRGVTFASGAVGTLRLDAQTTFTGAIGGLALGDAITFSAETVSSAVVSGTTLTVVGSAGTTTYQVAGALSGNHFAVQADQHTIKLVGGAALQLASAAFLPMAAVAKPAQSFAAPDWIPGEGAVAAAGYTPPGLVASGLPLWHEAPRMEQVFAHH